MSLLVFTILLGVMNSLVVNEKVVLYLFYLPVVLAAWMLSRRDAVGVAMLAALLVLAYAVLVPQKLLVSTRHDLAWAEMACWGGILIVTAYLVSTLRARTQQALESLQRAYEGVLAILSRFVQTVDADTEAHSVRVAAWCVRIGDGLNLERSEIEELRVAALLHDLGKVEVGVDLLRKVSVLSRQEQDRVREHTALGAAMVKNVGGMLAHVADAVEAHHERYDGSGYKGMRGADIPLAARIIAVADAFDALLSDRPYRKGVGIFEAMDRIETSAGSHFDPMVVAALRQLVCRGGEEVISQTLHPAAS